MNYTNPESNPETAPAGEPAQRQVVVQRSLVKPWMTYSILGLTVFVYLLQELASSGFLRQPFLAFARVVLGPDVMNALIANGYAGDLLVLLGGKIDVLIAQGQLWRLLTPALLHASLIHIGFNMYALYVLGPSLEAYYGHKRYLALYVLGALGGNTLSLLLTPGNSIGASTAIFALISAEAVFIYQNRALFGSRARPMLINVIVIMVVNLALGASPDLGIDNWGHLGGLLAGVAFAWFAGPKMEVEGLYPTYALVDKRSPSTVWVVGLVVFALIAVLAAAGMIKYQ